MFEFIKNFWKEMFDLTKTWSIRKQMLVCYVIVMIIILILILIVVIVNIYLLRIQTVKEIDKTLNEQADQNMLQLVKETAVLMHSQITQVTAMFELIQYMIYAKNDPSTYSLAEMVSYLGEELPEKCWVYSDNGQRICETFSSYYNTSEDVNTTTLISLSSLDNIWPSIWKLTNNIALRYYMYLPEDKIIKNFPGIEYPEGFDVSNFNWIKDYMINRTSYVSTSSYIDLLGTNLTLISVAYPLYNDTSDFKAGNSYGCIAADLPLVDSNYMLNSIFTGYLKTGFTCIVNKDGTILSSTTCLGKTKNLTEFNEDLWKKVTTQMNKSHFFIFDDKIYRVASYSLSIDINEVINNDLSDWAYLVLLIVEESDIMKYRDESKDKLETASIMLIAITLTCSIITIAVVTVLIHFLAKSITAPLKGIIDFTNKINAKATEKDMVTKEELDNLQEGDDQVAELVRTYKELAGSLITKKEERVIKPFQIAQNRVFPRNELYQKNKIDWKRLIDSLPD